MNPEQPSTPREEIEVQVTALLLGELPAPEADAVRELIAKDPELDSLQQRLSRAIHLLREVTAIKEPPDVASPAKLSSERREKLLQQFRKSAVQPVPTAKVVKMPPQFDWKWAASIAASIAILIAVVMPNFLRARKRSQATHVLEDLRLIDAAVDQNSTVWESTNAPADFASAPMAPPRPMPMGSNAIDALQFGVAATPTPSATPDAPATAAPQREASARGGRANVVEPARRSLALNWAGTGVADGSGAASTPPRPGAPLPQLAETSDLFSTNGGLASDSEKNQPQRAVPYFRGGGLEEAGEKRSWDRGTPQHSANGDTLGRANVTEDSVSKSRRYVLSGIDGVTTTKGSPGDWDRGQGKHMDGSFGNKVDEGNVFFDYGSGENNGPRVPYFRGRGIEETGQTFFTPNRQLPSDGIASSTTAVTGTTTLPGNKPAAGGASTDSHLAFKSGDLFDAPANTQTLAKSNEWASQSGIILTDPAGRTDSVRSAKSGAGPDSSKLAAAEAKMAKMQNKFAGADLATLPETLKNLADEKNRLETELTEAKQVMETMRTRGDETIASAQANERMVIGNKEDNKLTTLGVTPLAAAEAKDVLRQKAERPAVHEFMEQLNADEKSDMASVTAGERFRAAITNNPAERDRKEAVGGMAITEPQVGQTANAAVEGEALAGRVSVETRAKKVAGKQALPAEPGLEDTAPADEMPATLARAKKDTLADAEAKPQEVTATLKPQSEVKAKILAAFDDATETVELARKMDRDADGGLSVTSGGLPGAVPALNGPTDQLALNGTANVGNDWFFDGGAAVTNRVSKREGTDKGYLTEPLPTAGKVVLGLKLETDAPAQVAQTPPPIPQPEVATAQNAFSTFSLNVSDVSFKLAAATLEQGKMPDAGGIRSEEFINALDYHDPEPAGEAPIAFNSERARYPFAQNRDLLRFSVKTAASGRIPGRSLNLVLLIDNSGSMERADRVQIMHEALRVLSTQLNAQDKISVISFARTPRLWVDGASGDKAAEITERVSEITPEGGTNLSAAINLGYETARKHYQPGNINRVVLLTDGAANLGEVNPDTLKKTVETNRKQGIAIDCFGVGWEGYNDDLLEQLSRNGDGRYGFINSVQEAGTEFAGQLAGALKVAASDVKVQVEFNRQRVPTYRQIGYAKHQLTKEQFRDNTVDAAEIGAAESGNALYVVEVNPQGQGDLATVRVRFKDPGTSNYHEHEFPVPYTPAVPALEQASPTLRLAATASAFSEWLANSPYAAEVNSDRLLGLINGVPGQFAADPRPQKLEWMIRQAKSLSGR